jgi:hypothetical protein
MPSTMLRFSKLVIALSVLLSWPKPAAADWWSPDGWLPALVCEGLKITPGYWSVRGAIVGLKESGAITSKEGCLQLGDTVGDFSIPTGTFKNCICSDINWSAPPSTPPLCAEPHNACTVGVSLARSSAMMGCTPTRSQNLAGLVCEVDPFCCQVAWDQLCVNEVTTEFWKAAALSAPSIPDTCVPWAMGKQVSLLFSGLNCVGPPPASLCGQ